MSTFLFCICFCLRRGRVNVIGKEKKKLKLFSIANKKYILNAEVWDWLNKKKNTYFDYIVQLDTQHCWIYTFKWYSKQNKNKKTQRENWNEQKSLFYLWIYFHVYTYTIYKLHTSWLDTTYGYRVKRNKSH